MEKQGWSATLQWRQRQQDYFLRIIAPLGGGIYELSGNEDGVLMRTAKNMTLRADNPETLLQNNFGWHVPLSGLVYWLRGLPEPGSKTNTLVLDDQGRITDLVQAGWQISYLRYMTASGFDLPGKIVIQNDKLKVQLIIRDWKI